jgi:hypothetical protein
MSGHVVVAAAAAAAVYIFVVFIVCVCVCVCLCLSVCLPVTPDVPNDRNVVIFRAEHSRKSEITHPPTQHLIQEDPNLNEYVIQGITFHI